MGLNLKSPIPGPTAVRSFQHFSLSNFFLQLVHFIRKVEMIVNILGWGCVVFQSRVVLTDS